MFQIQIIYFRASEAEFSSPEYFNMPRNDFWACKLNGLKIIDNWMPIEDH